MMTMGVWGQRPQQADSQCCRYGCELASTCAGGTANSLSYNILLGDWKRKEGFVIILCQHWSAVGWPCLMSAKNLCQPKTRTFLSKQQKLDAALSLRLVSPSRKFSSMLHLPLQLPQAFLATATATATATQQLFGVPPLAVYFFVSLQSVCHLFILFSQL